MAPMRPQIVTAKAGVASVSEVTSASRAVARGFIQKEPAQPAINPYGWGNREHATRLWLILWLVFWTRLVLEGSMDRSSSLLEVLPNKQKSPTF